MNCLCPSKSGKNDIGVLSEYAPPAMPPEYNDRGINPNNFGVDNPVIENETNSILEGGSEVEDNDSQFFFDAREEFDRMSMKSSVRGGGIIANNKNESSSAIYSVYQRAKSVFVTTNSHNAHDPAMVNDEFSPDSMGNHKSVRLSSSLLAKHSRTPSIRSIRSGTTNSSLRRRRAVSMEHPETLLPEKEGLGRKSMKTFRNSMSVLGILKKPRVIVDEKGFPGNLTQKQLDACMEFRSELHKRSTSSAYKDGHLYPEMVGTFRDVEEEPYALCRFLRARDFNVEQVFDMMNEHLEIWKHAKESDYYPDIDAAMGCPLSIVLTQYPVLYSGNAKEGYPVCYFHAGRLTVQGIECITTLDSIPKMMWNTMVYQVAGIFRDAAELNPDFVRCEQITVINLEGLSASQVNSRTLDVVKKANAVAECIPEMLYRCIIINAPSFFAVTWRIIRAFLDKNTSMKIELYSNKKKGQKRLTELIDENSLPSDFDGMGPSTQEILCKNSAKNGEAPPKRRIVELVSVKRGGGEGTLAFDLKPNEKMKLQVFTRSELGGHFSLYRFPEGLKSSNMTPVLEDFSVARSNNGEMTPFSADLVDDLTGAGEYTLVGKSEVKSKATEYFLVIGDVYE
mmetsp:Transcript_19979/g.29446  ORF Transcript_19979/g.29446 Transcript_19979/m.29446 type:complete len:622 (+) Transcript_19979:190-2055(+)